MPEKPSRVLHAEGGGHNLPEIINPAKVGLLIQDIHSKALSLETLNTSAAYLLSGHAAEEDAFTVWLNGQSPPEMARSQQCGSGITDTSLLILS